MKEMFLLYLLTFSIISLLRAQTQPEVSSKEFLKADIQMDLLELFALDGSKNIMAEENFGIINGHITTRVNYRDVGTISGLFAPPFASSDFLLELRMFGEKVSTKNYRWYPFEVKREGELNGVGISTSTILAKGSRAGLMAIKLINRTEREVSVPLQLHIQGGLNYVNGWHFSRPEAHAKTKNEVESGRMLKTNEEGRIVIGTDIPEMDWFELGSRWNSKITLLPGEETSYHIAFEIGNAGISGTEVNHILQDPEGSIQAARDAYVIEVKDLFKNLPKFRSDNKKLEQYYYRSLVVLLTNKWSVPEFVLNPYFGSGAVLGGCVTLHLWEFGLAAQLFPLYDAEISRKHILQFLTVDITKRSRFEPMTGLGAGGWYPVNQDKIIELIYFYVLHTGDVDFLQEEVDGISVYEHVIKNALFGDDLDSPITLVDYGDEGENHLELRRGYPYRGIMPDLNALRYLTYMRAYELSKLAGDPIHELPERAASVKLVLHKELWSPSDKWFYFKYDNKKDIRLTNFMYLLIGTGVFDKATELALLSRLNETEFLGEYGIHSISKTDPAYDQVDIDHGGGGSYVAFPPLICQRFYNAGYTEEADDLLERHLWWGERLPYWGDSKVANYIGYRQDTPLQSDFDATSGAQTIIFGIFGVKAETDGTITINPVNTKLADEFEIQGLHISGRTLDIMVKEDIYEVIVGGKLYKNKVGIPTTI